MRLSILYFASGTGTNIATNVNNIDRICHVDFSLVHVIEHLFCAFSPDFIITTVTEKPYTNDNITCKSKTLLRFQELLLEARTATEGYYGIIADHFIV